MKLYRGAVAYTLFDHRSNTEILEELKVETVNKKLKR
jgi:hypothetical protein